VHFVKPFSTDLKSARNSALFYTFFQQIIYIDGILFLDTTTQDLAESTATEEPTTTAYSGPGAQLYGGTSSKEVLYFFLNIFLSKVA
jgi:hypothetical protein